MKQKIKKIYEGDGQIKIEKSKKKDALRLMWSGNGSIAIERQITSPTLTCPDCQEKMPKIFISHDDTALFAGYGSCGCQRPR